MCLGNICEGLDEDGTVIQALRTPDSWVALRIFVHNLLIYFI